jgi:SAM-dependent methyltransferase
VPFDVALALDRALDTLLPALDIVEGRVEHGVPPAWSEARGWTGFLCGLSDAELTRCEDEGLATHLATAPDAPASLMTLATEVALATRLPALADDALDVPQASLRHVGARKQRQLGPLLSAVRAMAEHAGRIVDVGAGHGHFTRLAAAAFDREALGLEREPARVAAAEALAGEAAEGLGEGRFCTFDIFDARTRELSFAPTDLAVGLHACGDLGDRLVLAAARAGCDLALVSCCLQKIEGPVRTPLSRAARARGMELPREALGLTNLTARSVGVEGSLRETMAAREHRHALLHLLRARGCEIAHGEEMRGINRRRAHEGLPALAELALARRGLAPATTAELAAVEQEARPCFARTRRLTLPRSMLGRLCEVAIVLDRAAALADAGHATLAARVFDPGASPRNLALFASCAPERLPSHADE